ncbi:hypothetical protein DPMN_099432 [Dreissena polymorpha]|uniref:Uncharacterized protein n=1 Tax=Dreissena polymorpha TaxID=45954 RepID=A0A9D4LEX5_DREPO|nr:hypothetical protein DPMN_099431 [Dreissena polymorpha]KAH3856837.1 hypothetical protein DPMN_099432 [Dreissena polymorpha]
MSVERLMYTGLGHQFYYTGYRDSCIQDCAVSSTTLFGAVKSYLTSVERLMYTGLCHQFYYTGWGS